MIKSTLLRVGLPLLAIWIVVILIGHPIGLALAGVATLLAAGLVGWAWYHIRKSKKIANILQGADTSTASGRKEAIEKLDASANKRDPSALFAKAQLLMQEDPRAALEVLEQIDVEKALPQVADEARGQRAMIHLLFGEVDRARALVDAIQLSRHEQLKARASLAAVVGEAWARSGQGKKATETLDLYDPESADLADLRLQLYRARAFASAAQSDTKRMRHALRRLRAIDPQVLGGFLQKKVHPLLEREAKKMLMQTDAVPKKLIRQRM